jgi:scyllo-inositol 2-dehydrogenase (NADP+)
MDKQKIRTGLLSYGMSGEVFHGPLLRAHQGFEVVGVFHRNTNKKIEHEFPVITSAEKLINDPSIELVIVNTPNKTHFQYAKDALLAGKHVIVEKPFTVTTKEADELIALAKTQGVVLTAFQNRRWDGGFLTVQKILQEKMLGRVVECEMHYDRYRNYIEANTWKEESDIGTGILYNLGSHMLDQVLVLFGMPNYVDARMGIQRTGGRVIDYYDIRIEYEGINVIVKSSYLVREQGPMYRINGTEGSYVKFGIDPQEQALKEKKVPGTPGWGTEPQEYWGKLNTSVHGTHFEGVIETVPGNYLKFYDNVFDAIRLNKPLAVKAEEARHVIRLIEASIESNQRKAAVKIA